MTQSNNPSNPIAAPLDPEQLATLAQANHLASQKQYNQAAQLYAMLAVEVENNHHGKQAANLHALAAHTYAEAQDESQAITQARVAMRIFIDLKKTDRTRRFYSAIIRRLQSQRMTAAVIALKSEFGRWGTVPLSLLASSIHKGEHLPLACDRCETPVRSEEVDWVDNMTVECAYCGTSLPILR